MKTARKHTRRFRRLVSARNGMANKLIKTRISDGTAVRLAAACKTARLPVEDVIRAGVYSIIRSIEESGQSAISTVNAPVLQLTESTRRRMAEIDHVLDIEDGHGVAERVLFHLVEDLMEGDFSVITDGWDFNDVEDAEANLRCVTDRWQAEDALAKSRRKEAR